MKPGPGLLASRSRGAALLLLLGAAVICARMAYCARTPGRPEAPEQQAPQGGWIELAGQGGEEGFYAYVKPETVGSLLRRAGRRAGGGSAEKALPALPEGAAGVRLRAGDRVVIHHDRTSGGGGGAHAWLEIARISGASRTALGLPIPINEARIGDLICLPGVGVARASAIVNARLQQGPLRSVVDLERVPGIGAKTARAIAGRVDFTAGGEESR